MATPGIRELIAVILPSAEETSMLRAAVSRGDATKEAWAAWIREHGGPERLLGKGPDGAKRLLPTLWAALRDADVEVTPFARTCIRTAYAREEARSRTYRGICAQAFRALSDAGVPFLVLEGASLAEHEYGDPGLRHCHDCDVLVADGWLSRAVAALESGGFSRSGSDRSAWADPALRHPSGLPVILHESCFPIPVYALPTEPLFSRSIEREVCGVSVRTLCAEDALLHVLALGSSTASRATLLWVSDAVRILHAHPGLSWELFLRTVRDARLALPVSTMLAYLSDEGLASVPSAALDELATQAAQVDGAARHAALFGAIAANREDVVARLFKRVRSGRQAATLLRWALLPPRECVRWKYGLATEWQVSLMYGLRPFRGAWHRARGLVR